MAWHAANHREPTPPPAPAPQSAPYNADDAARVRALMGQLGVSQAEVARAGGVSGSTLWDWLNGRRTQTPSVVEAGAAAMAWHAANHREPTPPPAPAPQSPPYSADDAARCGR